MKCLSLSIAFLAAVALTLAASVAKADTCRYATPGVTEKVIVVQQAPVKEKIVVQDAPAPAPADKVIVIERQAAPPPSTIVIQRDVSPPVYTYSYGFTQREVFRGGGGRVFRDVAPGGGGGFGGGNFIANTIDAAGRLVNSPAGQFALGAFVGNGFKFGRR